MPIGRAHLLTRDIGLVDVFRFECVIPASVLNFEGRNGVGKEPSNTRRRMANGRIKKFFKGVFRLSLHCIKIYDFSSINWVSWMKMSIPKKTEKLKGLEPLV